MNVGHFNTQHCLLALLIIRKSTFFPARSFLLWCPLKILWAHFVLLRLFAWALVWSHLLGREETYQWRKWLPCFHHPWTANSWHVSWFLPAHGEMVMGPVLYRSCGGMHRCSEIMHAKLLPYQKTSLTTLIPLNDASSTKIEVLHLHTHSNQSTSHMRKTLLRKFVILTSRFNLFFYTQSYFYPTEIF